MKRRKPLISIVVGIALVVAVLLPIAVAVYFGPTTSGAGQQTRAQPPVSVTFSSQPPVTAITSTGQEPKASTRPPSTRTVPPSTVHRTVVAGGARPTSPADVRSGGGSVPGVGEPRTVIGLALRPMPVGSVSLVANPNGMLGAQVDVYGLTPGSAHTVDIEVPGSPRIAVALGMVIANGHGQVNTRLAGDWGTSLPAGSRVILHLGAQGARGGDQRAAEPIAETGQLPARFGAAEYRYQLVALNASASEYSAGRAELVFDPNTETITVTVSASGLTPGAHAVRIEGGSCASQGDTHFALTDLVADGNGDIVDQAAVVTGVAKAPPSSGWYLDIHQGDRYSLVNNGMLTQEYQSVFCADV